MKLAFEAPIGNTEQAIQESDYIFAIAPMLLMYPRYLDAIIRSGKEIYLDNGEYEGLRLSNSDMISLCLTLKPKVVVLPDVIGSAYETMKLSAEFLDSDETQNMLVEIEPMGVVQGNSFNDMDECLDFYRRERVELIGLALGGFRKDWHNRIRYYYHADGLSRIHLLGAANIHDLCFWQKYAESADTSLPFHLAQNYVTINRRKTGSLDWTRAAKERDAGINVRELREILSENVV